LGKFVLIKDEQIVNTFSAIQDALKTGYEKFKDQPFFVRQVVPCLRCPFSMTTNQLP
jgi:hypothetical protein